MKIAIAQINTVPSDFEGNFAKIRSYVEDAERRGADIIVFPELALSGYLNQDIIYTSEFVRNNQMYLKRVEKIAKEVVVVIGHISVERNMGHSNRRDLSSLKFGGSYKYFNSASVFYKKKRIFLYCKEKLPSFDVFNEERYFSIRDQKQTFYIKGKRIGLNICEDIWFERGPYERQASEGAEVIINISASPFYVGKPEIRIKMIQEKARKFGVFTVYVNSVGGQDELIYDGNSLVFDSQGRLIAKGSAFEEELLFVDLDFKYKINPKFDKYEMIFNGIILGIRDYFKKNSIKKAIVGLSGGVDSALVSTLCKIALGDENIINVFMPSDFTSDESKKLVDEFIKRQNTRLVIIPISNVYNALREELKHLKIDSFLPYENLQSRIRGNILMFIANSCDGVVVATSNKNEIALGYNTLYGDTVGALSPIGDLYKDEVILLCRYINKRYGSIIPEGIIDRVPTAELRDNQKDEDDLPPYSITNRLLLEMIEMNRSDKELVRMGFDREVIESVHKAIKRSEFKRYQMPPIIKLKPKSFGFGRRIPITHNFPFAR
ncbi:MAG: NAD+ synthase [Deltaproteobacteria bacterium]|nr:NAD+ synthase [Deltaproteobacteria bacterium]